MAICVLGLTSAGASFAHPPAGADDATDLVGHARQHGQPGGHLPASRRNVELVGKLRVADAVPGRIADVGSFGDFAYLAAFAEPSCNRGGVYVVDIEDPRHPREAGFIPAHLGSYVGEGVHVIEVDTAAFEGDVLVHNNETCAEGGEGGISLWDVSDPRHPVSLAENVGDTTSPDGEQVPVRSYHSVFAWQAGRRAFVVASADFAEAGVSDVDIIEITDPRHPRLIAETGLADWLEAAAPLAHGERVFNHDMVVQRIRGRWTMLVSYWDAGYVELDVDDPANPRFLRDSDFTDPDPVSGASPAEGNAHYAEFDPSGRFVIGTDEDFAPSRPVFEVTAGAAAGRYPAGEFGFSAPIDSLADKKLNGPTVFGGYGCDDDVADIPPPSALGELLRGEEAVLVLSRGPLQDPDHAQHDACFADEKVANAAAAGYGAVIIANHHVGSDAGPDAFACGRGEAQRIPAICVGHRALHLMFGRTPAYSVPYPAGDPGDLEPDPGDLGPRVEAVAPFDGWGYIHLFDARTLRELDTFAIREAKDPAFRRGFGALTVHEVAFDPTDKLAYLSWYDGGLRVVSYEDRRLDELGHFIDIGGNDFWGVQVHRHRGRTLVLASDRDSGLYVFRYTGPRP